MFRPTRLSLSETVDPLSANCNTCPLLLLHSHHQHHFYLSLPTPAFTPLVLTDPLTSFLCALSLSRALAKVQVSVEIYISFPSSRLNSDLLNRCGNHRGSQAAENHHAFRLVPLLSWVCVSSVH